MKEKRFNLAEVTIPKPKYSIGDEVYFLENNRIHHVLVFEVALDLDGYPNVFYYAVADKKSFIKFVNEESEGFACDEMFIGILEKRLFENKKDLIQELTN